MFLGLGSTLGPPGGPGGQVNGGHGGASFLKICILDIFGNISSNLSLDRCQKPPKIFFVSQGARGAREARGASNRGDIYGGQFS